MMKVKKIVIPVFCAVLLAFTTFVSVPVKAENSSNITSNGTTSSTAEKQVYSNKTISLPDGGTEYHFNVDNQDSYTRIPPDNFDFATATDEQLDYYGIPHNNNTVAGLPRDSKKLKHLKSSKSNKLKIRNVTKPSPKFITKTKTSATTSMIQNPKESLNWAGALVTCGAYSITEVEGNFNQPNFQSLDGGNETMQASWVGIGGCGTFTTYDGQTIYAPQLLQCGTGMYTRPGSGSTTQVNCNIYAWYEFLNANHDSKQIVMDSSDIQINPGDDIYCDVIYKANQSATFFVSNHSNGTYSCHTVPNMSAYYNGVVGEWIDERPSDATTGNMFRLTNFGTIKWNKCNVYRRNSPSPRNPSGIIGGLPSYPMKMINNWWQRNIMVNSSFSGPHGFWDTWIMSY